VQWRGKEKMKIGGTREILGGCHDTGAASPTAQVKAGSPSKNEQSGEGAHELNRFDEAGQDGDRNGDVASSDQDGEDFGEQFQPRSVDRMADAKGLKHAPEAVIKVIAEHNHGDDVESGDRPDLEAGDDVVVDVVLVEGAAGMDRAEGEVEKVEDNKAQDDRAAPHHGAGGVGGAEIGFLHIADRASLSLQKPKLERRPDVQGDGDEESDARAPNESRERFKGGGVVIDFFRREKDLQVAEQVADDKAEKNDTRDGHYSFLADGGLPEAKCARPKLDRSSAHGMN